MHTCILYMDKCEKGIIGGKDTNRTGISRGVEWYVQFSALYVAHSNVRSYECRNRYLFQAFYLLSVAHGLKVDHSLFINCNTLFQHTATL